MHNWLAGSGVLARLRSLAPATAITLVVGLGATAFLYAAARGLEEQRSRSEFEQVADARFASVAGSFGEAMHAVRAVNLLFRVNPVVTREQFELFAHDVGAHSPYLQALVFRRFVGSGERAAYEAERRRLWPGFRITVRSNGGFVPAPPRERYLVADYVVPLQGNEIVNGFDGWSEPGLRRLAQQAIDSGQAAASGLIHLLKRDGSVRGMLVSLPVYRHGAALRNVADRRAAATGDTVVAVDVAVLIRNNLARASLLGRPGVALEVYGIAEDGRRELVLGHNTIDRKVSALPGFLQWLLYPGLTQPRTLDIAGSRWYVRVTGQDGTITKGLASLATLGFGILLSLTAAAFVQSLVARRKRVEALVGERTEALARATGALRLLQRAVESSTNAVIIFSATAPGYPIEYVNPAYERMMGCSAADMVGRSLAEMAAQVEDQPAIEELRLAVRERRDGHGLLRHPCKDGSIVYRELYIAPVNDAAGRTEHFVMTQYDVTTAKRYEAELEHRARYDTLTGLANRALLADRVEQAIAHAQASGAGGEPVWVAVLDLDHFKSVNDTLGHQAGDRMLQEAGARIAAAVGRGATVARTGGDEFVLLLTGFPDERQAGAVVRTAMAAVAAPMTLREHSIVMSCSAGLAMYPADGADPDTLVQHAEIAMYRAKEGGRNAVQFFTASMNERARERLVLEAALRDALAGDQFELHYQPQVDPATGWVVGMEALIRWRHPRLGMVRPDRFIGLAEETGLIVPIGAWVLRTACQQGRAWERAGFGPLRIAVNLSARQFADPDLKQAIAAVLADTGLDPACLEIELTETLVMGNVEAAIGTMRELKRMGVQLSIDDFGTGYSSLSYLKRFPVDVLKIDRSFVADIAASADAAALVGAIISLAHGLRLHVIAEGVETHAQLEYLRGRGCDEVQGHVYSRALPGADFERILREGRRVQPSPVPA